MQLTRYLFAIAKFLLDLTVDFVASVSSKSPSRRRIDPSVDRFPPRPRDAGQCVDGQLAGS